MGRTLAGRTQEARGSFLVYHDESEPVPNRGWLLIGLLFVAQNRARQAKTALAAHRSAEQYHGEVHFSELPSSFGGEYGGKARVARRWMRAYEEGLSQYVCVTILCVDRASTVFRRQDFAQDFHIYNRFTAMAIKSGIAWHLLPSGFDRVKDRKTSPDRQLVDNFQSYLPRRVESDIKSARHGSGHGYPEVFMQPVQLIDSQSDDLLQLIDLILGASQEALVCGASRRTKMALGQMVARWHTDTRKEPWKQRYAMHRRFSLWGFPDPNGKPYNALPLAIENRQNLSLF